MCYTGLTWETWWEVTRSLAREKWAKTASVLASFNSTPAKRHFPPLEAPLLGGSAGWAPAASVPSAEPSGLGSKPRRRRRRRAVSTAAPRSRSRVGRAAAAPACLPVPGGTRTRSPPPAGSSPYPCGHRGTGKAPGARARAGREGRGGGAARVRAQLAAGRAHSPRLPRESSGSRKRRFPAHAQLAGRARAEPRRREGGGRGGKLLR